MSKLDWFTIIIVAICIFAIGLLIYNATSIFTSDNKPTVEISEGDYDEHGNLYVEDDHTATNTTSPNSGEPATDYVDEPTESKETVTEVPNKEIERTPETTSTNTTNSFTTETTSADNTNISPKSAGENYASGRFMVLIGSYSQMASAKRMQRLLAEKGYRNSEIEIFNGGKYARVLVDRFSHLHDATNLRQNLLRDGFSDIIVQEKRSQR